MATFDAKLAEANSLFQKGVDLLLELQTQKGADGVTKGDAAPATALWAKALTRLVEAPAASNADKGVAAVSTAEVCANLAVWDGTVGGAKSFAQDALDAIDRAHEVATYSGDTAADLAFWRQQMTAILGYGGSDNAPAPTWASGGCAYLDRSCQHSGGAAVAGGGFALLAALAAIAYAVKRNRAT